MSVPMNSMPHEVAGAPPVQLRLSPLTSQARLAYIGTGVFTAALLLASAILVWSEVNNGLEPALFTLAQVLWPLTVVLGLFGYITLCLWMQAASARLTKVGIAAPPAWKAWVPWFVPIWGLFGPFIYMRKLHALTRGTSTTVLTVWWSCWLASVFLDRVAFAPGLVGTSLVVVTLASAALTTVSYVALITIIKEVSAGTTQPVSMPAPVASERLWAPPTQATVPGVRDNAP